MSEIEIWTVEEISDRTDPNNISGVAVADHITKLQEAVTSSRELRTMLENNIEDEQSSVAALQTENDQLMTKLSEARQTVALLEGQINQYAAQAASAAQQIGQ